MERRNARELDEGCQIDMGWGPQKLIVKIYFNSYIRLECHSSGEQVAHYDVLITAEFESEDGKVWKRIDLPSLEGARNLAQRLPAILRRLNDGQLDMGNDRHTLVRLLLSLCTANPTQSQVLRGEIRSSIEDAKRSQK